MGETRFATVNGVRAAFETSGDGFPLLLLHGFPRTRRTWEKVAPALAERFAVVAPDRRGYGESEPPADPAAYALADMAADVLAIWIVGFHVGLPVWVAAYLFFWTRAQWPHALAAALAFEAFIIGILDLTLDIFWFEPLLFRWIGVAYPFSDWFTRVF